MGLVVDLPAYVVGRDGGASITERGLTEFFGGDAWFCAIGLRGRGRSGHPRLATVPRPGLAAGAAWSRLTALAAGCSAGWSGYRLGPGGLHAAAGRRPAGDLVPIELTLRARASLLTWPFFAIIPVLLGSSLGRDDEEPQPLFTPVGDSGRASERDRQPEARDQRRASRRSDGREFPPVTRARSAGAARPGGRACRPRPRSSRSRSRTASMTVPQRGALADGGDAAHHVAGSSRGRDAGSAIAALLVPTAAASAFRSSCRATGHDGHHEFTADVGDQGLEDPGLRSTPERLGRLLAEVVARRSCSYGCRVKSIPASVQGDRRRRSARIALGHSAVLRSGAAAGP